MCLVYFLRFSPGKTNGLVDRTETTAKEVSVALLYAKRGRKKQTQNGASHTHEPCAVGAFVRMFYGRKKPPLIKWFLLQRSTQKRCSEKEDYCAAKECDRDGEAEAVKIAQLRSKSGRGKWTQSGSFLKRSQVLVLERVCGCKGSWQISGKIKEGNKHIPCKA